MNLQKRIEEDLRAALKAREQLKLSVLRMAQSAIHNKEIQLLKKETGLSDEEVVEVLKSEVKKRKDASGEFEKAGRPDLAAKEKSEAEMLAVYLPAEISDEDLERILKDGIREAGASGQKDFGQVMKTVMPILKGKASGERISVILKKLLG
ncbi:MAG: GatB/YqeY domain-containing protein [Patescibacteria group bacterium]